jgi:hypothetical protein
MNAARDKDDVSGNIESQYVDEAAEVLEEEKGDAAPLSFPFYFGEPGVVARRKRIFKSARVRD